MREAVSDGGGIEGDEMRMVRRTIARWLNLAAGLAWRGISLRTIKRFPTVEHLYKAGLMTQNELEVPFSFPFPRE